MTGFIYGEPLGTNEATTMNEMEQKAERYFRKCLADHEWKEDGKTYVRVGRAVKQLERMYPKIPYALLRRQSNMSGKWVHLIIPAFHVEEYVNVHNYEEEDNWFSIEGSYRDVRAEQKHLIQVNMSA